MNQKFSKVFWASFILYPDDAVSIGVSWSLSATDRGSPGRAGRAPAQGARANGGRGRRGRRGRFGGLGLLPDLEDLDLDDGHGLGTWIMNRGNMWVDELLKQKLSALGWAS